MVTPGHERVYHETCPQPHREEIFPCLYPRIASSIARSLTGHTITWPNNARVAFWVAPNVEHYEYLPDYDGQRNPWPRMPYPDVREYSYRDYGNRVGFWRMTEVLDAYGIKCCVSLNLAVLEHYPGNCRGHGAARLGFHEPWHLQHALSQYLHRGAGARLLSRLHRHAQTPHRQTIKRHAGAGHFRDRAHARFDGRGRA